MSRRVATYGEVSVRDNLVDTEITTQNEWVQFTEFDTVGVQKGFQGDIPDSETAVEFDTVCLVTVSLSYKLGAGPVNAAVFEFEIRVNNGAKVFDNLSSRRYLQAGGIDQASVSMSGLVQFESGDTVELWVRNISNTNNILIQNATMSAIRVD